MFVCTKKGGEKIFHREGCHQSKKIKEENKVLFRGEKTARRKTASEIYFFM